MRIIDQGLLYNAEQSSNAHGTCTFPTMYYLACGDILVAFRRGSSKDSPDGNCLVAKSVDVGRTWQIISEAFDPYLDGEKGEIRAAQIAELDDGTLFAVLARVERSSPKTLYDAQTDEILPTRLLLSRSNDGGRTWEPTETLCTEAMNRPCLTPPMRHIPGKGWLVFFSNLEPEHAGGPSVHGAYALLSPDDNCFETIVKVAQHRQDTLFYWDQRQAVQPDTGRLVGMFWTYHRQNQRDMPIHMSWGDSDTLTWEDPFSTGIEGQIAAPIPLAGGRLLAFYVRRSPPGSMRLIASEDGGKTWDHGSELVVYNTAGSRSEFSGNLDYAEYWDEMNKWTFGHPAAVVLDDQTVLLTYYAGPNDKCLGIHWACVQI